MSLTNLFFGTLVTLNKERQSKKVPGKQATTTKTLNNLPENILLHILSFLPTQTAIQTSLISHKWINLWSKLLSLNFPYDFSSKKFINKTLLQRSLSSPLQKLYLQLNYNPKYTASWILYAIRHNVEELNLDFYYFADCWFSFFLLRDGCVKVLRLKNCCLSLCSSNSIASLGLKSLRSLVLEQVSLLHDSLVCDLISLCVNLESLSFDNCGGMKDIKICSLMLKDLKLREFCHNNGSLEISCPNLASMEMINFRVGKYDFKDLSGLIAANISFEHRSDYSKNWIKIVRSLAHVRSIKVENWGLKILASKDVFAGNSLHNLKHLELQTDFSDFDLHGIASLLKLSPNLETVVLVQLKEDNNEMQNTSGFGKRKGRDILTKSINLCLPSLKQVIIKDFRVTQNVGLPVSLLILHGIVLEKITLASPTSKGESLIPSVVLHRRLEQVKLSDDQVNNIKFKVIDDEIIICKEDQVPQ